jgi:Sporulation and spore germination
MIPRQLVLAVSAMLLLVLFMGIYVGRMRRRATETAAADTRPVAAPVNGPTETVTLYVASDADGAIQSRQTQIPLPAGRQQRAEELMRALLRIYQQPGSPHPIALLADLRSIYLVAPGSAVIDLNAAFADQHRSGILTEQLTVNSMVETLALNTPGIARVSILVEGKRRDTLSGHADLSAAFDVRSITQSIAQAGH